MQVIVLTVCVLLATSGGFLALRAAFRSPVQAASGIADPLIALWPEHDASTLAAAQAQADAGAEDAVWRTDPRAVTVRFGEDMLGWADPIVEGDFPQWVPDDGIPRIRVGLCPYAGCPIEGQSDTEFVLLAKLGDRGEAGIWSVVAAEGDLHSQLDFGVPPAIAAHQGQRMDAFTLGAHNGGIAEGTEVETGTVAWGGCQPTVARETHRVWFRYVHFILSLAPDPGCEGAPTPGQDPDQVRAGAVFGVWPAEASTSFLGRLIGADPTAVYPVPLVGVSIVAAGFEAATKPSAKLPAWLDEDPASLSACGAGDLSIGRSTSGDEPIPPAPYGIGTLVVVRPMNESPCRLDFVLSVEIVDGKGSLVPLQGDDAYRVAGVLPSYVPDTHDLRAFWRLGDWCPPIDGGPYSVRLSRDGEVISTTQLAVLADTCTQTSEEWVSGGYARPPEGRGTPMIAPLG